MEQQIQLNDHNKQEYPPMHTAEHLLNATMVKPLAARVLAMPTSKKKEQMRLYTFFMSDSGTNPVH